MNFLTKMASIFMKSGTTKGLSLVSILGSTTNTDGMLPEVDALGFLASFALSFVNNLIYSMVSFVLSIIDIVQMVIFELMGIGSGEYVVFDQNNPLIKFLTHDTVARTFKTILIVTIVAIIVFTIFSVVMSEYKAAASNGENDKGRIFGRSLRSLLTLAIFPAILFGGIILVNSLLAGFNNVFYKENGQVSTFGNVVFSTTTSNANRYRIYAQDALRVPILIDFEDPYQVSGGNINSYTTEELLFFYDGFEKEGKQLYADFYERKFKTFNEVLNYDVASKRVSSSASYAGFEKFLCTPEQYYIMADFVDYAFKSGLTYDIKSVTDEDIEWKYVDESVFNKENNSLTIRYKDASNLTGGEEFYEVYYIPSPKDATSPISAAFDTVSNILGIGEYENNEFDILSREEDSINVVFWETDKAIVKLSKNYKSAPTYTDLIILYEYYRYDYNNTLDCEIEDLENGIELPVMSYEERKWQPDLLEYRTTQTQNVVLINGNYYFVTPTSEDENNVLAGNYEGLLDKKDDYGDFYYVIQPIKEWAGKLILASGYSLGYDLSDIVEIKCLDKLEKFLHFNRGVTFNDVKVSVKSGSYERTHTNPDGTTYVTYEFYADTVTNLNKKVNWPQKIAQDLQTIYSDINLNLLMTTGDWLTKLSEIVGSTSSNKDYGQTFDTSLIHPLGLMISELFLNEICENTENNFSEYRFVSSLNENDIRSILLAIAGEENYIQLSQQIEYFVDIFNAFMVPVLEEVAYMENIDFAVGLGYSEQIYTYKAYLCSVLLSSTCAEYLFDATSAIIGASEFSYDILEYANIVEEIYDEVINGATPAVLKNIYVSVEVDGLDYEKYINPGSDFGKVLDSARYEMKYEDFKKDFFKFDGLFEYEIKEGVTVSDPDNPTFAEVDIVSDAFRDTISKMFDFTSILNYDHTKQVIDKMLERTIVLVEVGSKNQVRNIVSDVYKALDQINSYWGYLQNIYDTYIQEMNENGYTVLNNPDFEHVQILNNYLNGSIPRWDLVKRADLSKVRNFVGQYNTLNQMLTQQIQSVSSRWKDRDRLADIFNIENMSMFENQLRILHDDLKNFYDYQLSVNPAFDAPINNMALFSAEEFLYGGTGLYAQIYKGLGIAGGSYTQMSTVLEGIDINDPVFSALFKSANTLINGLETIFGTVGGSEEEKEIYGKLRWSEFSGSSAGAISVLMEIANDPTSSYQMKAVQTLRGLADYVKEFRFKIGDFDHQELKSWLETQSELGSDKISQHLSVYAVALNTLSNIHIAIEDFLDTIENIDSLTKYYITYTVSSFVSSHVNTEFDVVVNSKHYTVGSNYTAARLAEYVLGGKYLTEHGYDLVFVDEEYEGFLQLEKIDNGTAADIYEIVDTFTYLRDFLCEFGEASVNIFNVTNFKNLGGKFVDELVLYENPRLLTYFLNYVVDTGYLSESVLSQRFDLGSYDAYFVGLGGEDWTVTKKVKWLIDDTALAAENLTKWYDSVAGYLFITDQNDTDLHSLALKDLRLLAISRMRNYEQNSIESPEENQARFLTLFALSCADWDIVDSDALIDSILSTVSGLDSGQEEKIADFKAMMKSELYDGDYEKKIMVLSVTSGGGTGSREIEFNELGFIGGLKTRAASQGVILKLAGIENRPYEEIVGLEYSIDFDMNGADEADGDIFVICIKDEGLGKYVPFMMTNTQNPDPAKGYLPESKNDDGSTESWITRYPQYKNAITNYYVKDDTNAQVFYPIIARGVFDSNGNPTAIRKSGNNVEYYRENVVIRSASKIGLQKYYVQMENVHTKMGFVGQLTNFLFKVTTGKSLVERANEAIPRLDVVANLQLPYGVDDTLVDMAVGGTTSITYQMGGDVGKFDSYFNKVKINIVMLCVASCVLVMFVGKAAWGCVARILDIVTLYILGPFAISTINLKSDKKNDDGQYEESDDGLAGVYGRWKQEIIKRVLLAFGYVFGLNIFYVLAPMVVTAPMFDSAADFANVPIFGGLPLEFINAMALLVMVIALSSMLTYAPTLFAKVMNIDEAFSYGQTAKNAVQGVVAEVSDTISGQKMMDNVANLKDFAKKLTPGRVFMEAAQEKARKAAMFAMRQALKIAGTAADIPPEVVDAAMDAYEKAENAKREAKKKKEEKERKEREARQQQRDSDFGVHDK